MSDLALALQTMVSSFKLVARLEERPRATRQNSAIPNSASPQGTLETAARHKAFAATTH
ncbi:hypothetical protein SBA7_260009 [Candidatus Sulfotelmatobacter sp. SbA7]|nr:hypothetical protein SBA7_260009 [Candidatus Sulfotelmatobacter sp. SbA7]